MDLNSVSITGRITRDVEVRNTPSGMAVAEISVAINGTKKGASGEYEDVVHFVDVTLFGRTAEVAAEYCGKGSRVAVDGRLTQDRWQDKESGANRSKLKVVANQFVMLGSKGDQGGQTQQAAPAPASNYEESDVPF